MPSQAPVLDPRSEVQLAQEVRERLAVHVPEWHETDPASGAIDRVGGAVIGAFAHLAATVVERLNRAPDKNFLAFVDLLRSEEHTSELQSRLHLVCRLLLEKKKKL